MHLIVVTQEVANTVMHCIAPIMYIAESTEGFFSDRDDSSEVRDKYEVIIDQLLYT